MNVEQPETLVMIESIVYKSNGFAISIIYMGTQFFTQQLKPL